MKRLEFVGPETDDHFCDHVVNDDPCSADKLWSITEDGVVMGYVCSAHRQPWIRASTGIRGRVRHYLHRRDDHRYCVIVIEKQRPIIGYDLSTKYLGRTNSDGTIDYIDVTTFGGDPIYGSERDVEVHR